MPAPPRIPEFSLSESFLMRHRRRPTAARSAARRRRWRDGPPRATARRTLSAEGTIAELAGRIQKHTPAKGMDVPYTAKVR